MSGHEQVTAWQVLPTGCPPDHVDADVFTVRVEWHGPFAGRSGGGYSVTSRGSALSRAGNWDRQPERFRRWQYRFETLTEAQDAARTAVDAVTVNGGTFAQWLARRERLLAAR